MYGLTIPDMAVNGENSRRLNEQRDEYHRIQLQLSSGKKYRRRSENAIDTEAASVIKNENVENNRWKKNAEFAASWEQATDGSMKNVLETLQRVSELDVQINNGVNDPAARESLATEVNWLIETLYEDSNQKFLGVSMYGGTDTGSDPFVATTNAAGEITSVSYVGSDTQREVQVSESSTAKYGMVGGGVDGLYIATGKGINVFNTLVQIRDDLRNGDIPAQSTLQEVNTALEHVIDKTVINGANQRKLATIAENLQFSEQAASDRIAQIEDVDMAAAATDLSNMETAMEATLQMLGRANKLTILDYV